MEKKKIRTEAIIPAQAGYFVVSVNKGEAGKITSVDKKPIVAWHIQSEDEGDNLVDYCYPVTLEGAETLASTAILEPSGEVSTFENRWPDIKRYLMELGWVPPKI